MKKKYFLLLSIFIFLFSLTSGAYCTERGCGDAFSFSGLAILLFGVLGVGFGGAHLAWLANPLLFLSWVSMKKSVWSLVFAILATLMAISFLFFDKIMLDEAGNWGEITGYTYGYWLWLLSMVIMVIAHLLSRK